MKAIIHIGTQKTGTTTIQTFLAQNRPDLSSQGFRFEPFTPRNPAQMELGLTGIVRSGGTLTAANKLYAMGVKGAGSQRAYVDRFEAMISAGTRSWPEDTYLASSEQIHAWLFNPHRIEALHRFLTDHFDAVRYLVYYRAQDDFMLSTYSEAVKRGEILTLAEHIDARIDRMNFYRRAKMWASVVGREALDVRLFDPGALINGDLLDDFCAAVGIDRTGLKSPEPRNRALSAEQIELLLRLGKRVPARLKSGAPNPLFHALNWILRHRLPRPGTPVQLTPQQRAAIQAANAPSNERLRAEFFPDRETLFTPRLP